MRRIAITAVPLAVVLACSSSYGDAPSLQPDDHDAGAEAAPVDAAMAPSDAAETGSLAPLAPLETACPPSFNATCVPGSCPTRTLFTPPAIEFPFHLASDTTSVYWLAQSSPAEMAYDGNGTSRLRRVTKDGASAAILVEDQERALALVLDEDWVYWAASTPGSFDLRRVRRDCVAPCVPEALGTNNNAPVIRLLRQAPGILVLQTSDGDLIRFDVAKRTFSKLARSGRFPAMTLVPDAIIASAGLEPSIKRLDLVSGMVDDLPIEAAGVSPSPGLSPLATDCTSIFGYRTDGTVLRATLDKPGVFGMPFETGYDVFDLAADARYLYVVRANEGGVDAFDLRSRTKTVIATGNVWFAAVDAEGVYWGDHDRKSAGSITMMLK